MTTWRTFFFMIWLLVGWGSGSTSCRLHPGALRHDAANTRMGTRNRCIRTHTRARTHAYTHRKYVQVPVRILCNCMLWAPVCGSHPTHAPSAPRSHRHAQCTHTRVHLDSRIGRTWGCLRWCRPLARHTDPAPARSQIWIWNHGPHAHVGVCILRSCPCP